MKIFLRNTLLLLLAYAIDKLNPFQGLLTNLFEASVSSVTIFGTDWLWSPMTLVYNMWQVALWNRIGSMGVMFLVLVLR